MSLIQFILALVVLASVFIVLLLLIIGHFAAKRATLHDIEFWGADARGTRNRPGITPGDSL